ncbi:MAG: polyprenyl synthetase family protein [Planctomycetota bacterium]
MTTNPLGFAGGSHTSASTRHGWSKALQLAPDLYPGVGGKRFRAALLQHSFEFAGGSGSAPAAIIDAVEMLHAGSLVIDDFEDNSSSRRDQPALHRVVGSARAVNAGNWMYFRALELAATVYEDPGRKAELLTKFIEVSRQCHEGQAIDLSTRVDEVTPRQAQATALAISRWKTGRLVSLAAWCGAHAAGGDAETLRAAAAFGCRVGICLQMKNDLDELTAFAEGSSRSDDLRNRRVTWPWAWAARDLPAERFTALQRRVRRSLKQAGEMRGVAKSLASSCLRRGVLAINARLEAAADRLAAVTEDSRRVRPLTEMTLALSPAMQGDRIEVHQ